MTWLYWVSADSKHNMTDVTRILNAIERGDGKAVDELLPVVYEELRLLAAQKMSQERPGQTLQATALVHEAYVRLLGDGPSRNWDSRGHFFAAAAEAMRRILIENARRKKSQKSGGDRRKVELNEVIFAPQDESQAEELISLNDALGKLAEQDKAKAELIKLRFFAGLTIEQVAEILGISIATAKRRWTYARAWLIREIGRDK